MNVVVKRGGGDEGGTGEGKGRIRENEETKREGRGRRGKESKTAAEP